MTKTLTLIRGLPGSGKSTMARAMTGSVHIEADMWHLDDDGNYNYNHSFSGAAHSQCLSITNIFLRSGKSVVVSNTFTCFNEILPYIEIAEKTNAEVKIITATGSFGSIHGVPDNVIEAMKARWEEVSYASKN